MFLAMLASSLLYAQRDELRLISSSHSRLNASTGNITNYRPVYEHNSSTLSADSGYIHSDNEGRQFFDAFGQVVITQPNGTVIYADKLHYVVETQLATLTNNVRMVDGSSVLTTNYLTYNMRASMGTYTGGGRIVNATDTITSKNAYYFDNTKDAYFRYDVIVRTPDVKIYTDTMRYNSGTKITYFFGPTNIKGNKGENLYTERGEYNTDTEQAWFDQNNLYTEGSRFLRGDSLYYDGVSGNGRAVDNVVFIDTSDQFFAYGGVGIYHRGDESITMTENPLVVTVTRNDNADTDSLGSDNKVVAPDSLRENEVEEILTDVIRQDSIAQLLQKPNSLHNPDSFIVDSLHQPPIERPATDSIYMTADTLFSQLIPLKDYAALEFNLNRDGGDVDEFEDEDFGSDFDDPDGSSPQRDFEAPSLSTDSLLLVTDTLQKAIPDSIRQHVTDSLKTHLGGIATILDSTVVVKADSTLAKLAKTDITALKPHIQRVQTVPLSAGRDMLERNLTADSVLRSRAVIPTGGEVDSLLTEALAAISRPSIDTIPKDSLAYDTAKTRIIKAYYNVRLFKSDLQAVADSVYYGYPDSMMRFFGNPMIWAQGSQMVADTLYMQIRNERLDNMLLVSNAFMVNTQLDSTKYNQIKGRRITGFFANNELEKMFVDGNAESIYYNADEKKKVFTDMYHNRSSRIKVLVDSNQITHFIPIRRVDGKVYPIHLVPQEAEILDGFVWKPGDRPTSKEDLLARRRPFHGSDLMVPTDTTDLNTKPSGMDGSQNNDDNFTLPDSVGNDQGTVPAERPKNDSLTVRDSTLIGDHARTDSLQVDSLLQETVNFEIDSNVKADFQPIKTNMIISKASVAHDAFRQPNIPSSTPANYLLNRFPIHASRLYRPGPNRKMAR